MGKLLVIATKTHAAWVNLRKVSEKLTEIKPTCCGACHDGDLHKCEALLSTPPQP